MNTLNKKSYVIWFTGLPASGKTTLADGLSAILRQRDLEIERLDGDQIRLIFPQTEFTKEARNEHIRRIGFLASRLEARDIIVVASFVSPYCEARDFVRELCHHFIEIHLDTPLEICIQRDPKGLYKQALQGQLKNMTGIHDPYEPPLNPEIKIDTSIMSVQESLEKIVKYLDTFLK
jgi:adenylylsulfate kinase